MNNDLISREYVEKIVIAEFVDLQDGTDEWRTYVNDTRMSCDLGDSTEAERKSDNLPSCNSCLHNGTWDCIKCKGFDKYERR